MSTECQWKALDATDLVPGSTAHDRFQEWVKAGVFLKLWQLGVERFDELKRIDWEGLSMDGAMTQAPLGGEDTGKKSDRPGQARRQKKSADRGAWCAHWPGGGGSESP
jgi:putative transposase